MNNSDPVSHAEKLRHVQAELRSYHGEKRESGEYTFVLCPYHSEKTPSGQIFHGPQTRLPGYFLCRGCGEKGSWNKIAPVLGLKPFTKQKPEDAYSVPLAKVVTEESKEKLKYRDLPRKKVWREIKTNFLIDKIKARYVYKWNEDYQRWGQKHIWLPVHVGGDLKGYIRARLKKDPEGKWPSYYNKKGGWSKRTGLFPFDPAIRLMKKLRSTTMVLVEGPRDALRLLSYGIPCMAILGTTSWTMFKPELLELHGVERVIVMMDGDDAGIAASELVMPDLKKLLQVKRVRLWALKGSPYRKYARLETDEEKKAYKHKLWDPGNCPEWILEKIKSKYFER